MKIVVHDALMRPQVLEVTRVVVYDAMDNPVAIALKYGTTPDGKELLLTAHIGEEGGEAAFNHLLHEMGIDKTVVVSDVPNGTPLNQVRFDGG
jgi:hypothetical protein